jgi:hypothetical protein
LFLQGALEKLAQTLEDQKQRHGNGKVGCVKNLPRERELGHEQIFLNYFTPSPPYNNVFFCGQTFIKFLK